MELNLSRPIVFFDLETTGVQVGHDHIVEMFFLKILPGGAEERLLHRVRPADQDGNTLHIPEVTTKIHGISDADVADKPSFKELAPAVAAFIGDADLAGYNSNKFDVPMLVEEFLRAGQPFDIREHRLIDVQNIFHRMESRTLRAAYRFYCGGKDFPNPHSADADALATYEVLKAQLDRYQDVSLDMGEAGVMKNPVRNDVDALSSFSTIGHNADLVGHIGYNAQHQEIFNFGKYKGTTLEDVFRREPSYFAWMLNADFPLSTKAVVQEVKARITKKAKEEKAASDARKAPSDNDLSRMSDEQKMNQLRMHFMGE